MSTPVISVRKLNSNHDPIYGNGPADFLTDIDAVAQLIDCALLLFQGEWWADTSYGLPLFQLIVGKGSNPQVNALLIQQTIMSVPFVTGISDVSLTYTSATRTFSYTATVQTVFGTIQTTYTPGSSASIPVR